MHLRIAKLADAEEIAALEHELFPWNNISPESMADELIFRTCWVAVDSIEGKLRGYVLAKMTDDYSDVIRLGVSGIFQGNRLGSRLLGCVFHAHTTFLTVAKNNTRAVRFYLHNGFHVEGECAESWLMMRRA